MKKRKKSIKLGFFPFTKVNCAALEDEYQELKLRCLEYAHPHRKWPVYASQDEVTSVCKRTGNLQRLLRTKGCKK